MRPCVFTVFMLLLGAGAANAAPGDARLAIVGARLIDGSGGEPLASSVVLIGADGRILAAGPPSEVQPPKGIRTVQAAGMTLMPGLIDGHVHLAWDKSLYTTVTAEEYEGLRTRNPGRLLVRAARHAQLALAAGITTVRDCGADDFSILALRDAVKAGEFTGPRILASGRPITTTAGHTYSGWGVDGVDEVRKAVRHLAGQRVDFIKFVVSGGTTTPGTNIGQSQYTLEEVRDRKSVV